MFVLHVINVMWSFYTFIAVLPKDFYTMHDVTHSFTQIIYNWRSDYVCVQLKLWACQSHALVKFSVCVWKKTLRLSELCYGSSRRSLWGNQMVVNKCSNPHTKIRFPTQIESTSVKVQSLQNSLLIGVNSPATTKISIQSHDNMQLCIIPHHSPLNIILLLPNSLLLCTHAPIHLCSTHLSFSITTTGPCSPREISHAVHKPKASALISPW